ncbi:MAG: sugar transferase [Chloroflexota bacterium]|nr:sugar transferase [Chloroflexota bacterium]
MIFFRRRSVVPLAPSLDYTVRHGSSPSTLSVSRAALSRSKRVLDVALAGALLALTSPVWLALALVIGATTRGPVLFRQQRIGLGGVPFTVLKFRTMHHRASEDVHERFVTSMISALPAIASPQGIHKLQDDLRITRVGRWIRRMSLDELPQMINVLRGEMSIVGPRPPLAYEVAKYEPWQYERLAVRPGITGLWQVSGRNRLTYFEMCKIDVLYVRSWSLWTDLRVILRTPWVMFFERGGAS